MIHWTRIKPKDAVALLLPEQGIQGPLDTEGNECPWPWEPQRLKGAPMGQYHCSYCDEMCVAGMVHPDYTDLKWSPVDAAWVSIYADLEVYP